MIKRQDGMKINTTTIIFAAALLLMGCSAYYRQDPKSASESVSIQIETEDETEPGPGIHTFSPEDMTIESLEISDDKETQGNPEIIIATDIHYLAKELSDFGNAFEAMSANGDGKVIGYVWEITDAFLDEVIARKPQALLLTGDLSLEGELFSHEALAGKLERVERAGIDVAVIPGNHDINNARAARYSNNSKMPTETTTPEQFASVYGSFGYDEAVSRDPDSLSYIYELPDGTWVFMLDSCQYDNTPHTGGMIRTGTYEWMEQWLEKAWTEQRNVIAAAHHNLLDESRIYQEDCTIEHSEQLEQILYDLGVKLFLSGHLHVQHYRKSDDFDIQEIVTSSLSISPCQYGVLKYFDADTYDYHTEQIDVTDWAQRNNDPDSNLQNFRSYADSFLQDIYYNKAYRSLNEKELSPNQKREMAEFYAILNVYSVAGKAVDIMDWALSSPSRELWAEYSRTDIESMYLDEIIEDAVCDYNTFQK